MPGSVSCIGIYDPKKEYGLCLENEEAAQHVLKSFKKLFRCRIGDNLIDTPVTTVDNILKASCLGLEISFDVTKYNNDVTKARAALETAMLKALTKAAKNLKPASNKTDSETAAEKINEKDEVTPNEVVKK